MNSYPNFREIVRTLQNCDGDVDELAERCKMTPGVPCKPMLAKPTKGIHVIFKRFEEKKFTCEFKYDGLRGQLHYSNGEVRIFSRNLEDMTSIYPDVCTLLQNHIDKEKITDFIADSEIVAIDPNTNRILPFQVLMQRSKKNVTNKNVKQKVCLYAFDLIYLNGKTLLDETFRHRREKMFETLPKVEGKLDYVMSKDTDDTDEIQTFLEESVALGCEGLMIKTLDDDSTYEPCKRSFKWLKLKNDYLDKGLGDTFDLVPIGAVWGTGKRVGMYSSYLIASYNQDCERYETCTLVSTGFTEKMLKDLTELLKGFVIDEPQEDYEISSGKNVSFLIKVIYLDH